MLEEIEEEDLFEGGISRSRKEKEIDNIQAQYFHQQAWDR